jgi:hypothetical protein
VRARQHRAGRGLQRVPRRLHGVEAPDGQRTFDRLPLLRARHGEAHGHAAGAEVAELGENRV